MNVTSSLLFHLDIPLLYGKKLEPYYYIPENRMNDLQVGGFVYLVDKLVLSKEIHYGGILYQITNESFHLGSGVVSREELAKKYHFFYRMKITKIQHALVLLDNLQK